MATQELLEHNDRRLTIRIVNAIILSVNLSKNMRNPETLPSSESNPQEGDPNPDNVRPDLPSGILGFTAELAVNTITASTGLDHVEMPQSDREELGFNEFREMLGEYGLDGDAKNRIESLKAMPKESLAIFMTDLNRRALGHEESQIKDETSIVGGDLTISPEDRYDLFSSITDKIKSADEAISPERVADVLALTTVLLHPFEDGNGRTARLMGYLGRADFDKPEDVENFDQMIEPRDIARERGGWRTNGYIARMGEGADRSDPEQVKAYIDKLLTEEGGDLYTGPSGQAPLRDEGKEAFAA